MLHDSLRLAKSIAVLAKLLRSSSTNIKRSH